MKKIVLTLFVMLAFYASMLAQTTPVNNRHHITCLGTEMDGSQTLRVLGYGRNRGDAKEQAMKNAVWAVIFEGIREGAEGCNMRPLVTEVNARERYEEYFNRFFADGGAFMEYVSLRDTKKRSADRRKDKVGYTYEMTIRVLRSELKARLKADNVISNDHL